MAATLNAMDQTKNTNIVSEKNKIGMCTNVSQPRHADTIVDQPHPTGTHKKYPQYVG